MGVPGVLPTLLPSHPAWTTAWEPHLTAHPSRSPRPHCFRAGVQSGVTRPVYILGPDPVAYAPQCQGPLRWLRDWWWWGQGWCLSATVLRPHSCSPHPPSWSVSLCVGCYGNSQGHSSSLTQFKQVEQVVCHTIPQPHLSEASLVNLDPHSYHVLRALAMCQVPCCFVSGMSVNLLSHKERHAER